MFWQGLHNGCVEPLKGRELGGNNHLDGSRFSLSSGAVKREQDRKHSPFWETPAGARRAVERNDMMRG